MRGIPFNDGWSCKHLDDPGLGRPVSVPHDAMLEERRSPDAEGGLNVSWFEGFDYLYTKKFTLTAEEAKRHTVLEFEGVYIGVVVITDRMDTPTQEDLIRLVANAAGIPVETAGEKVTIIRDSGPVVDAPAQPGESTPTGGNVIATIGLPLPILIAIAAGILLFILLLVLLLVIRAKKKKKNQVVMEGDEFIDGDALSAGELAAGGDTMGITEGGTAGPVLLPGEEEDEFTKNEEILNLRMQRSLRLKQNIAEFVDQNPQIAAKLVQGWLRGEEGDDDGRNKHSENRRKQS